MSKKFVNMFDMIFCLTNTGDLISNEIANHHKRVAYLAFRIADSFGLSAEEKREIFLAGLLHDVGAFSSNERLVLLEEEPVNMHSHAFIGASILEQFGPLSGAAHIIKYHHVPWKHGQGAHFEGEQVPLASHLLHLADRIAVQINGKTPVIGQIREITEKIRSSSGELFMPELTEAFLEISGHEYIWLDTVYEPVITIMPSMMSFDTVELSLEELIDLTGIFANIIDFRSPFTARHSMGVAAVAEKLAKLVGFSENECKMMQVAGYLHDLGKLAVDTNILEKPDVLGMEEFNQIRSHTFYTYRTLQVIKGFRTINTWASLHHERLDGTGYPFHLKAPDIPLGSRVMAVADVFTAITEDRPYRKGMDRQQVCTVITDMAGNGSLCPYVSAVLAENYGLLDDVRMLAQRKADEKYRALDVIRRTREARARPTA